MEHCEDESCPVHGGGKQYNDVPFEPHKNAENGWRMMSMEDTMSHLRRHYDRALSELDDDRLSPHIDGLTHYATTMIVTNAIHRASLGRVPWHVCVQDCFQRAMYLASKVMGEEEDGDQFGPGGD